MMKKVTVLLVVSTCFLAMPVVCWAGDTWIKEYEDSSGYTKAGDLLPPRGVYAEVWGGQVVLKRFYTGTVQAFKGPEEGQLTLKVRAFSAVQAQDAKEQDEEGYLFCMFFKDKPCPECDGKGKVWVEPGREECPQCGGKGKVRWRTGFLHDCMACDGKGYIEHKGRWKECDQCEGSGRVVGRTAEEQKELHIRDRKQYCFEVTVAERITLDVPEEARYAVFVLRRDIVKRPPKKTREDSEISLLEQLEAEAKEMEKWRKSKYWGLCDEVLVDAYRVHGDGPTYAELHLRRK